MKSVKAIYPWQSLPVRQARVIQTINDIVKANDGVRIAIGMNLETRLFEAKRRKSEERVLSFIHQ